ELKIADADWLPPALLTDALKRQAHTGTWSLEISGRTLRLISRLPDGTQVMALLQTRGERIESVWAEIDDLPRVMNQARQMAAAGQKTEARQMLNDAIRATPRSTFAAEA